MQEIFSPLAQVYGNLANRLVHEALCPQGVDGHERIPSSGYIYSGDIVAY